jgi:hypothetical protein
MAPLRELDAGTTKAPAYLFEPANAVRIRRSENHDTPLPPETPAGENPPTGAIIDYALASEPAGLVALEIRRKDGTLVRRYATDDPLEAPDPLTAAFPSSWLRPPQRLLKGAGMHRFVWDLRYAAPKPLHPEYSMGAPISAGTVVQPEGPLALPGGYTVQLLVGGRTYSQPLVLIQDPRVSVPFADLESYLQFALDVRDGLAACRGAYDALAELRGSLATLIERVAGEPALKGVLEGLEARTAAIVGRSEDFPRESTGLIGVGTVLGSLATAVDSADAAPTDQIRKGFAQARAALDKELHAFAELQAELPDVNRRLAEKGIPTLPDPRK